MQDQTAFTRQTVLASAIAILLVIPCYFLGGVAVMIYFFFHHIGGGFDFGFSWIPFLNGLLKILWEMVVPEIIRGIVTGYAALAITMKIFPTANENNVIFAASFTWGTILVIMMSISALMLGINQQLPQTLILAASLFAGCKLFQS